MDSKFDEKEFKVIAEIARNGDATQREISKRISLSLGMVNIILKRLTSKGYVKVTGLNQKKMQYILTPEGFAEKVKKSYHYFWKTLDTVKLMKAKVQELVLREYVKGQRKFFILGQGELADIIETAIRDLHRDDIEYSKGKASKDKEALILIADKEGLKINNRNRHPARGGTSLNISEELAGVGIHV